MTYLVEIEPLGETIEVEDGQTILSAALRAGIYLPHACGHGLCSTCKVDVLEGEVEIGPASPFALMDIERDEGKCLTCCATPKSDLVIEADIEEDEDAEKRPVKDFDVVVTKIETLTPRIKAIFLANESNRMEFQAGQYINVEVPGLEGQPRAFSIASAPTESKFLELNVSRVDGGEGTGWIHDTLQVGDTVSFSGPYGRFFTRKSRKDSLLFLAGGSGLSSPKSMILDLLENDNDTREITLIYGARNQDELYYRELFESLEKRHQNFRYIATLSDEPEDSGWQGHRGFVHEIANTVFEGKFEGLTAYLCGPPPMIDACVTALMRGRCFERSIFMENFYTNANKDDKPKSPLFKAI